MSKVSVLWVGVRRALDQIAEQQLGDAIELPRADIAHFNPAYIHLNNSQFTPVGQNVKFVSTNQTHLSIPNVYTVWNGGGNNDDDKKHRQGIGSMHSEQAAKVFLLMAPVRTSSEKPSEG